MGSRSYVSISSCQFFWYFGVTSLNERGCGCSLYRMQMGMLSVSPHPGSSQTGWQASPPMVNNATLHSGQLPIRKTAEAQRGGRNRHVTGLAQCTTHWKRPVLSESGRTQCFQFFLHHIFRGRPKASVAQHPGAALWKNDRAISTSFLYFRGGYHEEIDLLEQTMFPVSPSVLYPSLYSYVCCFFLSSSSLRLANSIFLLIYY